MRKIGFYGQWHDLGVEGCQVVFCHDGFHLVANGASFPLDLDDVISLPDPKHFGPLPLLTKRAQRHIGERAEMRLYDGAVIKLHAAHLTLQEAEENIVLHLDGNGKKHWCESSRTYRNEHADAVRRLTDPITVAGWVNEAGASQKENMG